MSRYKPLKPATPGWIAFKVIYPILFIIIMIIIFVIFLIITAILSMIPYIGPIFGGSIDIIFFGMTIIILLYYTIMTLYRVHKRKLSLDLANTWFCYILYSFIPGGSLITAYELR